MKIFVEKNFEKYHIKKNKEGLNIYLTEINTEDTYKTYKYFIKKTDTNEIIIKFKTQKALNEFLLKELNKEI